MTTAPSLFALAPGPRLPDLPDPARRRVRRRLVSLAVVVALGLGLGVGGHTLLVGFAGLFHVDDPAPADAIVVLLGGPTHRPARAAELYRHGLAPTILIGTSGVDPDFRIDETAAYRTALIDRGVPPAAIQVLPGRVGSTRDEAHRVADYLRGHPLRRIIVVTTGFHTARARWIFRKILHGTGVEVRMAAATHPLFTEQTWFRSDEGLVLYFGEAIKTLYYRLLY
jgi:uncharacterized SAM-binding protein YcdF (DUF218 family)